MGSIWLTSAAFAALVVAVVIYPWQRTLEHQFLLRAEKRELYREFLRSLSKMQQASDQIDPEALKAAQHDARSQLHELHLLTDRELPVFLFQVLDYLGDLGREALRANAKFLSEFENSRGDVDEKFCRPIKDITTNAASIKFFIAGLLRADLDATVLFRKRGRKNSRKFI